LGAVLSRWFGCLVAKGELSRGQEEEEAAEEEEEEEEEAEEQEELEAADEFEQDSEGPVVSSSW